MNTNVNKIAISIGSLAASGLLSLAVPTGTTEATFWKPPMPCVAVRAGVYPAGAGLCPGTTGGLDSNKVEPELPAGSGGIAAPVRPTRMTPSPT